LYHKYVVEGEVFPFACHEGTRGSGGIAPLIITLSTRWKWSASCPGHFTAQLVWKLGRRDASLVCCLVSYHDSMVPQAIA